MGQYLGRVGNILIGNTRDRFLGRRMHRSDFDSMRAQLSAPQTWSSPLDRARLNGDTPHLSAAPRAWTHPGLTAVVEYTDEPPTRHRERFEAGEVYRNLVSDGGLE